jgi:hypothetical protein
MHLEKSVYIQERNADQEYRQGVGSVKNAWEKLADEVRLLITGVMFV